MNSLLPVLLAHLLVDTAFKTEKMRVEKSRLVTWWAYVRHGLLVSIIMWIALALTLGTSWRALICAAAIAVIHICTDFVKYLAIRVRDRLRHVLAWVFLDFPELLLEVFIRLAALGFHVVALDILTGFFFPPRYELASGLWYVHAHLLGTAPIPKGDLLLYLAILYLLGTLGGARVIQFVERAFYPGEIRDVTITQIWETSTSSPLKPAEEKASYSHTRTEEQYPSPPGKPGTSYFVGILERLVIMLCPLIPTLGLPITAVLGLKSIARFNQFKHRAFVEYFIIGTFSSLIWGAIFAWLVYRALRPQANS